MKFRELIFEDYADELKDKLINMKTNGSEEDTELLNRAIQIYNELVSTDPTLKKLKRDNNVHYYALVGDINKKDKFCC